MIQQSFKLRRFLKQCIEHKYLNIIILIVLVTIFYHLKLIKKNDLYGIETIRVKRNKITRTLMLNSVVTPFRMTDIKSSISGEVVSVNYNLGDTIKINDSIIQIKQDPDLLLEYVTLHNKLEKTKLEFSRKEKLYFNSKDLYKKKYISIKEYESIQFDYKSLKIELSTLKTSFNIFKDKYHLNEFNLHSSVQKNSFIRAPFNGVILKNFIHKGDYIKSALSQYSEGTTICTIGDLTEFNIKLSVSEYDIEHIDKKCKVIVFKDNQSAADTGYIYQISPIGNTDSQPVTFDVFVHFKPIKSSYKPGNSVNVEIILFEKSNVLTIPNESVFIKNKNEFVLSKNKNKFIPKKVIVGISDNSKIEVISGLKLNDEIVCNPNLLLKNNNFFD